MNISKPFRYSAFTLLLIEFLLIFAPMVILGAAINWPASLDQPASINLPLILEQAGAVKVGYLLYLIYSVLIIPVAFTISRIVGGPHAANTLLKIANGFAIGSVVLRALGIIRWLAPMPVLAQVYIDPATSDATREAVTVMYEMLNAYAGSVGEVLGVGFFASLWVGTTSVAVLRNGALPRWLGVYGLVTALALSAGLLTIFDIDPGMMLTVSVSLLQFWWLFIALIVLFRPQWVRSPEER